MPVRANPNWGNKDTVLFYQQGNRLPVNSQVKEKRHLFRKNYCKGGKGPSQYHTITPAVSAAQPSRFALIERRGVITVELGVDMGGSEGMMIGQKVREHFP